MCQALQRLAPILLLAILESAGSFTGVGPDVLNGDPNGDPPFFSDITITNDIRTKSLADLNSDQTPTPYVEGESGSTFGATHSDAPYTNYSSNGAVGDSFVLDLQIDELGNSLAVITGTYNREPLTNSKQDPGQKTQDCYNQKKEMIGITSPMIKKE
jgi:hypothetical protein